MANQNQSFTTLTTKITNLQDNEHAKKIGIGLGVGLAFLVLIWFLLIAPARKEKEINEKEIIKLKNELHKHQTIIAQREKIQKKYQETGLKLSSEIEDKLVPGQATLAKVSILLREMTKSTGIELIERQGNFIGTGRRSQEEPPVLENFETTFELHGTYHQLGAFFAVMEKEYPYTIFRNFSISKPRREQDENTKKLNINITAKLPRFNENKFPSEKWPKPQEFNSHE